MLRICGLHNVLNIYIYNNNYLKLVLYLEVVALACCNNKTTIVQQMYNTFNFTFTIAYEQIAYEQLAARQRE